MKKIYLLLASLSIMIAYENQALATVGYQFNSLGQYAVGMSGAVIAAPADAMTVITNPAGLADIQAQGDASINIFKPTATASFGQGTIKSHSNIYGIPALSWMIPIVKHKLFIGGGLLGTAGMGVSYLQQPYFVPNLNNPAQLIPATLKAYTNISMMIAAIGVAWKPSNKWSLGLMLTA